jgi:hypothetical protein
VLDGGARQDARGEGRRGQVGPLLIWPCCACFPLLISVSMMTVSSGFVDNFLKNIWVHFVDGFRLGVEGACSLA